MSNLPEFKIGFLINPIAGMGGAVGLHGTDANYRLLALDRGAKPIAELKAARALQGFKNRANREAAIRRIQFLAVPGAMGGNLLNSLGIEFTELNVPISELTDAQDTVKIVETFEEIGVNAILFAGGDGTARDIFSVVGAKTALIGIPAGVKMRSSIFARFPEEISQLLIELETLAKIEFVYREILDAIWISPESDNYSQSAYYGSATSIKSRISFSGAKARSNIDLDSGLKDLAVIMAAKIRSNPGLSLIGSGTSTFAVKQELGTDASLQGVDAYSRGICIGKDLSELEILQLISKFERTSLLTGVIGGQGFLFGRGNQQISGRVMNLISWQNLTVMASEAKLLGLFPVELYVDFEDNNSVIEMPAFVKVRTAPTKEMLVRLRSSKQSINEAEELVGQVKQLVRSSNDR